MNAETQIRDLTKEWRDISTELEASEKRNAALKAELEKSGNQVAKMRERQKVLENEHRDVAQHVHDYYKEISELQQKLNEMSEAKADLEMDLKMVTDKFEHFKKLEFANKLKELAVATAFSSTL